ncbi:hypothetical protein BC939DRAFT_530645 [Gamsiella multidivaricata]|uniref:uncharacterized protein n=1 Tax=Gamsiella multidivaricata TaxID=101098 RepID=UPI00221ED6FB|nr:uncharacterized protein BC939DRAFT_530645 [Gamsiella multidivaricata]KAG0354408.1 hypothetical protein BGZ54_001665 [Gamsiella multidivaricata]KAI7820447.1 hypothetical protein BC939DRAFT_530645 [Gamsiella multidivaricata]
MPPKRAAKAASTDRARKKTSVSPITRLAPYTDFFKDPPNVDELMNSVLDPSPEGIPAASTAPAAEDAGTSAERAAQPAVQPAAGVQYRGLQMKFPGAAGLSEKNRPNISLATRYLQDRLRRMTEGDADLSKLRLTKGTKVFTDLAMEIHKTEPRLS